MTEHSVEFVKQAKQDLWNEYHGRVESLGCNIAHGISWDDSGNFEISIMVQREGKMGNDLIQKLETLLPVEYKGYKVKRSFGGFPEMQ
jgi:hypothetical protein